MFDRPRLSKPSSLVVLKLRTALEIPEIRDLVISFVLAAPSFNTAVLRVSWSFYRTFAPRLYETVDLSYSKYIFYSFIECLESRERLSAPPIMALKLSVPGSEFLWDNMFKRLKDCLARARPSRFIPVSLGDLHLKVDCCKVDMDTLAGIAWLIFNCKVLSDIFISGDDHGNTVGKLLGHFIQPSSPYFMEDRLKTMGLHCGASGYVNGAFGPFVFGTWYLDFEDVYDDGWISKSLIGDCLLVLRNNSRDMFRASVLDLTLGFVAFVSRCSVSEQKKWALVQKVVEKEEEEEGGCAPRRVILPPELDLLPLIQEELIQRGLEAMLSDLESDEESEDEESEENAEEYSGEGGSDDESDA